MKKEKRPGLPEARWAALRLLLLPQKYEDFTEEEREFICSDIVGEVLEGKYAHVFDWVRGITRNSKWILTIPVKPQ